jgi:hypothetical protein
LEHAAIGAQQAALTRTAFALVRRGSFPSLGPDEYRSSKEPNPRRAKMCAVERSQNFERTFMVSLQIASESIMAQRAASVACIVVASLLNARIRLPTSF